MSDDIAQAGKSRLPKILAGGLAGLVIVGLAGFLIYSSICPCERTPGGYLFGDRGDTDVTDWTFANEIQLCQLQIWDGIRPHSINLNCMASAEGNLYLSCSVCDTKYWASKVGADEPARLRLNGVVYKVVLNRVMDEAEMDVAWRARDNKLNSLETPGSPPPPEGAPREPRWWTFQVESAG